MADWAPKFIKERRLEPLISRYTTVFAGGALIKLYQIYNESYEIEGNTYDIPCREFAIEIIKILISAENDVKASLLGLEEDDQNRVLTLMAKQVQDDAWFQIQSPQKT
jgi:hypothetical protein